MNIKDLQYLVALADHKSFRKAAFACFISQPTLSMQVKKLEEFLQVKLVERNNRAILLTDAGKDIVRKAREILAISDSIIKTSENFRNPYAGDIKIGAFPTLAPYYFPKIIPLITKNFPDLNIYLIEEKTEKLTEMLEKGDIDTAFLALPVKNSLFTIEKVFSENFLLAAPEKTSPKNFAGRKKLLLNDIKNQKLLLLEDGHCLREQALEICQLSGANENKGFRATSLETLRNMVAAGMGFTLIPELARKDNDGIEYKSFELSENAQRDIALIWRRNSQRTKLFHKILWLIKPATE